VRLPAVVESQPPHRLPGGAPVSSYRGVDDKPELVGWCNLPGRGTTFSYKVAGRDLQIYVTEKAKKVRVFLDYDELM
jgi:hypothetical protein